MGSQIPNQRSNLCPLAVEAQSLNHWTTEEVLIILKLAIEVGHPFGIGHHWVAHTSPTVPTVPLMPSLGTQFLASSQ